METKQITITSYLRRSNILEDEMFPVFLQKKETVTASFRYNVVTLSYYELWVLLTQIVIQKCKDSEHVQRTVTFRLDSQQIMKQGEILYSPCRALLPSVKLYQEFGAVYSVTPHSTRRVYKTSLLNLNTTQRMSYSPILWRLRFQLVTDAVRS